MSNHGFACTMNLSSESQSFIKAGMPVEMAPAKPRAIGFMQLYLSTEDFCLALSVDTVKYFGDDETIALHRTDMRSEVAILSCVSQATKSRRVYFLTEL